MFTSTKLIVFNVNILNVYTNKTNSLLFDFLENLCSEFWQVGLLVPRRVADIFQFPFSHNTNYIPLLLDIYIFLNLDPDFLLEKDFDLKLFSIKD